MIITKPTLLRIAGGIGILVVIGLLAWGVSALFVPHLTLTSTAFSEGGTIPTKYTCDGEKVTPPLTIQNIPKGTRSLVLSVFDPDAPKQGFIHWVVSNMNPLVTNIPEGQLPNGRVE